MFKSTSAGSLQKGDWGWQLTGLAGVATERVGDGVAADAAADGEADAVPFPFADVDADADDLLGQMGRSMAATAALAGRQ